MPSSSSTVGSAASLGLGLGSIQFDLPTEPAPRIQLQFAPPSVSMAAVSLSVPAHTKQPSASSQTTASDSSTVVASVASQPSNATADSQCLSIDEDLLAFLADFVDPSSDNTGQTDLGGLNGLLSDDLGESFADFISEAVAQEASQIGLGLEEASTAVSHSQLGTAKSEVLPQDSVDASFASLMGELQQLNAFGKPM